MTAQHCVYALLDLTDHGRVFYVGWTKNLPKRLLGHFGSDTRNQAKLQVITVAPADWRDPTKPPLAKTRKIASRIARTRPLRSRHAPPVRLRQWSRCDCGRWSYGRCHG